MLQRNSPNPARAKFLRPSGADRDQRRCGCREQSFREQNPVFAHASLGGRNAGDAAQFVGVFLRVVEFATVLTVPETLIYSDWS